MTDDTYDLGDRVMAHLRTLEASGTPGLAAQVAHMFLRDTRTRLSVMREAIAACDVETLRRVAHTLQGSAAMVGAAPVAARCTEMSRSACAGSFDRCETLVTELDAALAAIERAVASSD
jgi:HPt (histidine-containing phosphotransfer) domain-containing protein